MNKTEREKKLKILLPVLILVSLFVWIPNFQKAKQETKSADMKKASSNPSKTNDLLLSMPIRTQDVQRKKSSCKDWGRNPFILKGWEPEKKKEKIVIQEISEGSKTLSVAPEEKEIILNGIFWNEKKPSALINDEVVGLGAEVGSFMVKEIKREKVLLSDGAQIIELHINE